MRITWSRLQVAGLLLILVPVSLGVITICASAVCKQFVRVYVTKPVRNRVSKATANAWAEWRVAHPNWEPLSRRRRSKYVMTREEQVHKVEFACQAEIEISDSKRLFQTTITDPPPLVLPPIMFAETALPTLPTELAQVVTSLPPDTAQEMMPLPDSVTSFVPPIPLPGKTASVPAVTSEPASLVFDATGLAGMLVLLLCRWIKERSPTHHLDRSRLRSPS